MGRRTSLASLAGAKVDRVPGESDPLLFSLPLDRLVPTRFNPRRNFGTEEELRAFGQRLSERQLQPAVVVSRGGYLRLWPDEEQYLGAASYVIVSGERRYRASAAAGRATLDVVHTEAIAESRATLLDAVLAENNDREDLDPIERAIGIETMVAELGGADQVAAHFKKSKGWVSQQRKLLRLTSDLQALVSAGEMPVREAREIAGLPESEQRSAWKAVKARRAESKAAPRAKRFTAVNQQEAEAREAEERFTAVNQRTGSPDDRAETPEQIVTALAERLSEADLRKVSSLLLELVGAPERQ